MRADLLPLLGSWLLTYLLHSTLLLGIAAIVTRQLVRSPAVREMIWKTALVGGFVTATLQLGTGWRPLAGALSLAAHESTAPVSTEPEWQGLLPVPTGPQTSAAAAAPQAARLQSGVAPAAPAPAAIESVVEPINTPSPVSLLEWILIAWCSIGAALLVRYLVQRMTVLRRISPRRPVAEPVLVSMLETLRHTARVRQSVHLTVSAGLSSPVALGRAEIALPGVALTDLNRDQQLGMLAHELAHLVRRDPSWLTLACVIERVFFLQPFNRLARLRMQEAAELLCDDWAVTRTGSGFSLASCLVKVAEWVDTPPHPVPLSGMAEHRSQLVTRIHRLIEGRPMHTAPRSLWLAAGAVTLLGVTTVAAPGVTSRQQSPDPVATASAEITDAEAMDLAALAGISDTDSVLAGASGSHSQDRMITRGRLAEVRAMRTANADLRRAMSEARVAWGHTPRPPRAPVAPDAPMAAMAPIPPRAWGGWSGDRAPAAMGWNNHDRKRDTTSIAVPALIAALKDSDVEVRRIAVQSLSNFNDPRAVPGLVTALKDTDNQVRIGAAVALGNLGDERALPGLLAALKDGDRDVRQTALSALSSMPSKVPDEAILTALGDSDADVRQEAINLAVSRMSDHDEEDNRKADPRYIAAFGRLLGDNSADIRQEAVRGLGSAGLTEPPAALIAAAKDKSADVRQAVAEALGEIGSARSVATLKEMLADPSAEVRESSINALSNLRDQSALEALVGALKSTDPVVRRSAAEALGSRDDR
jgi:HEAT repeat protein/beta-lactamase regulating signal transducer with metallopeptidase domain